MTTDRTEIQEVVQHEYLETNLADIVHALKEHSISTHQAKILAPIVMLLVEKQTELAKLMIENRFEHEKLLLSSYEKSKRRHYAARSSNSGCCFNPAEALRESEDDAHFELESLSRRYRRAEREDQQRLATMSMMLLRIMSTSGGSPALPAGDVIKNLLPRKSRARRRLANEDEE